MTRIFVEGREADFIDKYLMFLIGANAGKWEVVSTGGYSNLSMIDQKFKENSDNGGNNLVIFDADLPETDGGFKARKKHLEEKMKELSVSGQLFLFPNNKEDGDFESMLENIVNEEHRCLLECFERYEGCIGRHCDDQGRPKYVTPNRKAKIYAYVESFKKSNSEKEKFKNKKEFFFDNPDYWNLDSVYLTPLKEFLLENVK